MSKLRRKLTIVAIAFALALCLLLAILLLLPDRDSLSALQRRIADTGTCRISTPASDLVIQADTARIENDTLILERNAPTEDSSSVRISMNSDTFSAKRVSVRFIASPKDMLELTFYDLRRVNARTRLYVPGTLYLEGEGTLRIGLDRHWTLRQRFRHFCGKIKRAFK